MIDYYEHPFMSHSRFSDFGKSIGIIFDFPTTYEMRLNNFRLGSFFDALGTESSKVDRLNGIIIGTDYSFSNSELMENLEMKRNLYKNEIYSSILRANPTFQKEVYTTNFTLDNENFVNFKCKLDLSLEMPNSSNSEVVVDLKTTKETTQKGFENACNSFGYFRQMIFYMKNTGAKNSILFGISKEKPYNVFVVKFSENHRLYEENFEKCKLLIRRYNEIKELNNVKEKGIKELPTTRDSGRIRSFQEWK